MNLPAARRRLRVEICIGEEFLKCLELRVEVKLDSVIRKL